MSTKDRRVKCLKIPVHNSSNVIGHHLQQFTFISNSIFDVNHELGTVVEAWSETNF